MYLSQHLKMILIYLTYKQALKKCCDLSFKAMCIEWTKFISIKTETKNEMIITAFTLEGELCMNSLTIYREIATSKRGSLHLCITY